MCRQLQAVPANPLISFMQALSNAMQALSNNLLISLNDVCAGIVPIYYVYRGRWIARPLSREVGTAEGRQPGSAGVLGPSLLTPMRARATARFSYSQIGVALNSEHRRVT